MRGGAATGQDQPLFWPSQDVRVESPSPRRSCRWQPEVSAASAGLAGLTPLDSPLVTEHEADEVPLGVDCSGSESRPRQTDPELALTLGPDALSARRSREQEQGEHGA